MKKHQMPDWLFDKMTTAASAQMGVGQRNSDFKDGFEECFQLLSERMKWMSIESAPKNLSDLILYGRLYHDDNSFDWGCEVGGFDANGELLTNSIYRMEPTHWLPLPDAQMGGE